MMSEDPKADALLREAFEAAEPDDPHGAFTAGVVRRLGRVRRSRGLVMGGAGAAGSAAAGSQISAIVGLLPPEALGPLAAYASPQFVIAAGLSILLGGVAWFVPSRI